MKGINNCVGTSTPTLTQRITHGGFAIWLNPFGMFGSAGPGESYEARLIELLDALAQKGSNESIAAPPHPLEQRLNRIDTVVV